MISHYIRYSKQTKNILYLKATPRYFLEAIHKETELLTTRLGHRFCWFFPESTTRYEIRVRDPTSSAAVPGRGTVVFGRS